MKKIVINTCYGGFSVSHTAFLRLRELGQQDALQEQDHGEHHIGPREPSLNRFCSQVPRDDLKLIQVVEELGVQGNGHCADLKIVAIPPDVKWEIQGRDGIELVSEVHRQWS